MKIKFHPFLKEAHGRFGDLVFRLCHTGEWQVTRRPNMSKVKWSQAQQDHSERMAEATAYANSVKRSVKEYPELHEFYLQMAWEKKVDRAGSTWPSLTITTTTSTGWDPAHTSGSRNNGGQMWSCAENAENENPGGAGSW